MSLHVPSFAGGVVRFGSPDTQQTDELLIGDSLDIGPRGQLVCTTDVSDYVTVKDTRPQPLGELYAIADVILANVPSLYVVGQGLDFATASIRQLVVASLARSGAASPVLGSNLGITIPASGVLVTIQQWPGTFVVSGVRGSFIMVCYGAREGFYPRTGLGLYGVFYDPAGATFTNFTGVNLDFLGTGSASDSFAGGTKGVNLYPRAIAAYNNHLFAWGFDSADATNGDGPARVMFCNAGKPYKFGNDNIATSGDRQFTDSDAIVLGDAGEAIRAALKWNGRLYFGTNQQLHYIAGFGRDSFLTDGANPVAKSYNVIGPQAMVEGPDKLMYGVADQGLWSYDGSSFTPLFKKLIDFAGHSTGYWDCIWSDTTRAIGYPGRTNQDLVWLAVDWDREQVVVGIPFCNASVGSGFGADTVIIKYHPRSGAFTRQVFVGVAYTAAGYFRREGQQREVRLLGTASAGQATIQRYGYQAVPTASPVMPTRLPVVEFGPYAPFGPDGNGVTRRAYVILSWESAASLPLVFTMLVKVDESQTDAFVLSVQATAPGFPAVGDVWVDTSQSDTNLGNASFGTLIQAVGGYLVKLWTSRGVWALVPGSGEQGTRATIPLPLTRRAGSRITVTATCTAAAGRFQWEGLGLNPGAGSHDA